ncbi:hypothetical protein BJV82DRAFT_563224 [Fennellomyces sp. T-0311]|nr:hypothetical protein BJV82DRAFT_563224 [Fennellomyces sp. T-0311]
MQIPNWFLLRQSNMRITVPLPICLPIFAVPTALLVLSLFSKKIPNYAKQILSVPLLATVALTPIVFSCGNALFDLGIASTCFNIFLRLFELYWISPTLYNKPVYADRNYLYTELWSCLRIFPNHSKKNDDTKEPKEYIKDKKWYHIIVNLVTHIFICDLIGSWLTTFTGNEVITLRQTNPGLYFVFLVQFVLLLNSLFNVIGYSLHLLHCLYYDGGSYSQEQWHPLISNPIISTSLEELWSGRWHQLFHSTWVAFGFRPTRHILQRIFAKSPVKNPKPIIFTLASLAVFLTSGAMHEFMIFSNVGWSAYSRYFIGQQTSFFLIQGVGVIIERLMSNIRVPVEVKDSFLFKQVIRRAWVIGWAYFTFPFLMDGFTYNESWNDSPLMFTKPYLIQLMRTIPNGSLLCGSLL